MSSFCFTSPCMLFFSLSSSPLLSSFSCAHEDPSMKNVPHSARLLSSLPLISSHAHAHTHAHTPPSLPLHAGDSSDCGLFLSSLPSFKLTWAGYPLVPHYSTNHRCDCSPSPSGNEATEGFSDGSTVDLHAWRGHCHSPCHPCLCHCHPHP
jgi:hypothetical protein